MLRVALVNMPFAAWNRPSFALSQLSALIQRDFPDQVEVDVHYFNVEFAQILGAPTYEAVSETIEHLHSGIGDWLFRELAFPDAPDNTEEYFRRFYRGDRWQDFRRQIMALREALPDLCAELIDRNRLDQADIVGFTSMFAQNGPSIAMATLLKQRNPALTTLMGGANCEAPMGTVLAAQVPAIDYVFSGPALDTFSTFLSSYMDGRTGDLDAVPGILNRRNYSHPKYKAAIGFDHDINDFFPPDYSAFLQSLATFPDLARSSDAELTLFFETSRGCWWGERSHCAFCGLNGQSMGYRHMAPEIALQQFSWLFSQSPDIRAYFCTDNVMARNYPRDVFPHLQPPPGSYIYYEVKLPLSREDLAAMARAGVTTVQPGVEALASSTLKLMGKGTTAFQNLQFLKNCVEFGIEPDWNLLIGFPGETADVYEKYLRDLPLLRHLPPPHGVYLVRFDRFSPYFTKRGEYGLDLHPMDYYGLTYPFGDAELTDLAYFFADRSLAPYQIESARYHDQLKDFVLQWRADRRDDAVPRELRLVESGEAVIRDSRSGEVREYPADPAICRLLRRLTSPAKLAHLAEQWPEGAADFQARLDWLRQRDLLFFEDGRMLSLVLTDSEHDEEPAEATRPLMVIQRSAPSTIG